MTSAYGSSISPGQTEQQSDCEKLPYIPLKNESLQDGTKVEVDFLQTETDVQAAMVMLNTVIEEGQSWPFEIPLTREEFRSYFLSHTAFVVRAQTSVVGVFYVKPNFPGRSSHYCNGGFITHPRFRRRGLGTLMGTQFIRIAKDLGYKAVLFNLVYKSNVASLHLWKKLGFSVVGTLPRVGRLKGLDYVDAYQCYLDLTEKRNEERQNLLNGGCVKWLGAVLLGYIVGRSRHW